MLSHGEGGEEVNSEQNKGRKVSGLVLGIYSSELVVDQWCHYSERKTTRKTNLRYGQITFYTELKKFKKFVFFGFSL